VIELHDHIRAEIAFDLHHALGREDVFRPVDVTPEFDAALLNRAQSL
jgi:hypothetical protein